MESTFLLHKPVSYGSALTNDLFLGLLYPRKRNRPDLGDCSFQSPKGQQIACTVRTLVCRVDAHRDTHWYQARRSSTLLFRARKPYKICRLYQFSKSRLQIALGGSSLVL
jgi:hypothetical protein